MAPTKPIVTKTNVKTGKLVSDQSSSFIPKKIEIPKIAPILQARVVSCKKDLLLR